MNGREDGCRYRFLTGLAMGGLVGAGVALWLVPRAAAEIKARATDTAKHLGESVSERYRDARLRVAGAAAGLSRTGAGIRDDACDTVAHAARSVEAGAREVEQIATGAKSSIG